MTIRQTIHDVLAGLAEAVKPPSDDPADEAAPSFAGKNYRDLSYDIAGPALGSDATTDLDELRAIDERIEALSDWTRAEAMHALNELSIPEAVAELALAYSDGPPRSEAEAGLPFKIWPRSVHHVRIEAGLDLLYSHEGYAVLDGNHILFHRGNVLCKPESTPGDDGVFGSIIHAGRWMRFVQAAHRELQRQQEREALQAAIEEKHADVLNHTPVEHIEDVFDLSAGTPSREAPDEPAFADQA